jgi:methyl-accepting chemotaxis protein
LVAEAIEHIAHGLDEQHAGIEHVNGAIAQIDRATQQNAALVEELAACSEAMSDRSLALRSLVLRFDVADRADKAKSTNLVLQAA